MKLFHGSLNHDEFESNVFFSTSPDFAKNYGDVKLYEVNMNNTFDTLNEAHVKQLLKFEGSLYEPYEENVFHSYSDYLNSDMYGLDNWEMFEQYINTVKTLGFDSMRIFEGGHENFVVFRKCFELI